MAWPQQTRTAPGYESVLSMLTRAVMGHGWFYYVTIGSVLLVLALSANTAFADFPRLTRAIAGNNFLPHVFLLRGRRLLYSWGIYVLVALTALLLIIFGGVTDRLIPLYAIGAFMAFTLSQAGMVMHWRQKGGAALPHVRQRPGRGGHRHHDAGGAGGQVCGWRMDHGAAGRGDDPVDARGASGITARGPGDRSGPAHCSGRGDDPIVVLPIDRWSRITEKALSFALSMSTDIRCVHVQITEETDPFCEEWEEKIAGPLRTAGKCVPKLITLQSPYRYILQPLVDYVLGVEKETEYRKVCVLVPELVVRHWWENLLHNRRADLLKVILLMRGNRRIIVINIPWYLERN